MRKPRFTESHIDSILKDGDESVSLADLVRRHGIIEGDVLQLEVERTRSRRWTVAEAIALL